MTMTMTNVLVGLMFIVLGFLTLKYPSLIKNWRYATEEQRKNIDLKALQLLTCKSMVVSGTALIIVGIVSHFIKGVWPIYAMIMIVFAMSGYMVARMRRFDKNTKSRRNQTIAAAVLAISLFIVVGLFIGGKMENKLLTVKGRHDPCIVPRAVPVVEAAAAIAIYDMILGNTQTKRRK